MKIFKVLCLLFILFSLFDSQAQVFDQGTFLKITQHDPEVNAGKFISVVDLDNDSVKDLSFLFIDTLILLTKDSLQFFKAFAPQHTQLNYGTNLDCYSNQTGETTIYLSGLMYDPISRNIWSSFVPASNSFNYGYLSDEFRHGFDIDNYGNLWHIEYDTIEYDKLGIYKGNEGFSFSQMITYLGEGDSSLIFNNGTYRHAIFSSPYKNYISSFSTGTSLFNSGNPGGGYLYSSSDNGLSWMGESIIRGRMGDEVWGQVSNRDMGPHISPFNDYWCVIDNNGVVHISLYGIGKSVQGQDTLQCFPILYWNSREKNWIAISNLATEGFYDQQGNAVGAYAPGWGAGQALPMISVSKDGNIIIVGWTSPEYLGEPGSQLNIYPGDGGPHSRAVYYTDLIANISFDGGKTWNEENIFSLKDQENVQEQFLIMNEYLRYDSLVGKIQLDYMYLIDEIPGNSGWGNNSVSNNNRLYYDSLIIFTNPVSAEAEVIVYNFSLSQNYPNPFNPNTKINYSVGGLSKVSLKVYDILGREIITLVNEEKPAGKYEANFNASSLASGVYFYQIKAGNFVQSKKMILIK